MRHLSTLSNCVRSFSDFQNPEIAKQLLARINFNEKPMTIMEVCGTHTVALFRTGIRHGLTPKITLVSGPGCPVCVTGAEVIEEAIGLACKKDTVLFCFGDMLKVPGASGSLETAKATRGAQVRVMYSPLEALEYALCHPDKKVVIFGVGFETTVPLFASTLRHAQKDAVHNIFLLSAFKTVPPALKALLSSPGTKVDGFILPGHVSAIIGEDAYRFMVADYKVPGVITGFESVDMLEGISLLTEMIAKNEVAIKNPYRRFVSRIGNPKAQSMTAHVFRACDAHWRGLGMIPESGLKLRKEFDRFDARALMDFAVHPIPAPRGCRCADVIIGKCNPTECRLFRAQCSPSDPIGPCMVSSEGTCAAYFKYGGQR